MPENPIPQSKGDHGTTETVKVKADNEQGYAVINKSDFNEDEHTLVDDADKAAARKAAPSGDDMTKDEIMKKLDKAGVAYSPSETKAELLKKLPK